MDTAFADREQPRLLQELVDFLSIPSVSTLPAHAEDCRRAAEWLRAELTRLGCPVVTLIEGDGHPVVWAEGPTIPGRPTLLIYGHYDVQPPDPIEEWDTPPFEPAVRDGRLFARGAADDKGQVFCLLKAYEAVLDADGRPPLNVRFIFEGEEECGGHVVFDLLRAEPERTRADAALVCDMSYFAPEWLASTGLRGLCYAEISVRTLQARLHSARTAAWLQRDRTPGRFSRAQDEDGEIPIPKVYKSVEARAAGAQDLAEAPVRQREVLEEEVTGSALTGLKDYSVFERVWALPTFEPSGSRRIHRRRGQDGDPGRRHCQVICGWCRAALQRSPGSSSGPWRAGAQMGR
jgi:acetylornithine deacetylase/succinyl-diaminopimelate desuccinylase-like protein